MNSTTQQPKRAYSMEKRSGAAEQSSAAILDATLELYWRMPFEQVTPSVPG
jgi:hypothetical protein